MIDFRKKENRRELLVRYLAWQYRNNDLDPAIPLINYLFNRLEYNQEQRYWMTYLYAYTYNPASALAIFNEIPDFENIDMPMLTKWTTDTFNKVQVEKDVKWNKGHLAKMAQSYIDVVGNQTQHQYFTSLCDSDNPKENYVKLDNVVTNKFHKFGRYVSWYYIQSLKHNCKLNVTSVDMKYGPDSQSPSDGLAMIMGREDWMSRLYVDNGRSKIKQDIRYTSEIIQEMNQFTDSVIEETNNRFPDVHIDYFNFETALCSIKKLTRRRDGRYLGYYLDRLMKNVVEAERTFPGVDFQIIRDWIKEENPRFANNVRDYPDSSKMNEYLDTGTLLEFSMYPDLANN